MANVFLLLGGNIGEVPVTFEKAKESLRQKGISFVRQSSLYQSVAWGYDSHNIYYNQVVQLEADMTAIDLLHLLLQVEMDFGRDRSDEGYADRTLDLDILLYNKDVITTSELEVPHPRMHLRKFTMEPLHEIAPDLIHPGLNKTVKELLKECPDKNAVERI